MKKLIPFYLVLLLGAFCIQGCSDSETMNTDSFFSAQVNEELITVDGDLFAYAIDLTSNFNVYGIIDLDNQKSIYIQLPLGFSVGNHTFGEEVFAYLIDGDKAYSTLVGQGSGSIKIASSDGVRYTGTFQFDAFDFDNPEIKMSVTDGRFDVLKR